jgi:tRNA/tmRNA/rRNA uracil-C5-methylase (TrmA/RlmC/RlmD family)
MARKRKSAPKRKKRKSAVGRAAGTSIDIAAATAQLAKKIEKLRKELKEIKRSLRKKRR